MIPTSLRNGLKKIDKDLTVKIRFSERDQAPRIEIFHLDKEKKKYIVRGWSELEFINELKTYGIEKTLKWFREAKRIMQSGAQEKVIREAQARNQAKSDSRHLNKMDKIKALASENHVRNAFKEVAEATGL